MTTGPDHNSQQALQQLLESELELTRSLQQCLSREREALSQRDMDQLVKNTDDKNHCITRLENSARDRETLLQQLGLPVSQQGMQQLVEACSNNPVRQLWADLTQLAEQCREENRQLGMLIQRGQNSVQQAQHILQRGAPPSNHSYNASGNSDSNTKTRPLAKA